MRARRAAVAVALLAAATLFPGHVAAHPDGASSDASRRAAAYLAGLQDADGSVPAGWRADEVAEAVVALVAGGGQDAAVGRAVDFLSREGASGASSGPYAARIVAALVTAGRDPRRFAGTDFVARTASYYDPVSGSYGGNLYGDALAMLGLLAAREPLPDGALRRLQLGQCRDGGWSYQVGCAGKPDTDTTSMVVAVLASTAGKDSPAVRSGRGWLLANQGASGCWGHEAGSPDNANSCGLALSAIAAIGEEADAAPWAADGHDPPAALRGLQLPSGAFQYRKDVTGPNAYATVQAAPGLAGWAYPVRAPSAAGGLATSAPGDDDPPASPTSPASPTTTHRSSAPAPTSTVARSSVRGAPRPAATTTTTTVAVARLGGRASRVRPTTTTVAPLATTGSASTSTSRFVHAGGRYAAVAVHKTRRGPRWWLAAPALGAAAVAAVIVRRRVRSARAR